MLRIAALLIATAVAAVVSGGAPAAPSKPALRLLATSPLAVKGFHFRAGERMRVSARLDDTVRVRHARANRLGRFGATFGYVNYDPCNSSLVVTAVGGFGSRAALKFPQRECPPALGPGP